MTTVPELEDIARSVVAPPFRWRHGVAAMVLGFVLTTAGPAGAQRSDSATMVVGATVLPTCSITVTAMEFGSYDPLIANRSTPLDGQATLTTVCTPDTTLLIEMDNGQSGIGPTRRMIGAGEFLTYDLFKDPARSDRWGLANQGMLLETPPGQIAPIFRTVYGRVPGGQNAVGGDYSDSVQVTLHF